MKIKLLQEMKSCVTQGERQIAAGTTMTKYFTQLSWTYFKDDRGNKLIIMGYGSDDWQKVQIIK
jgi:hypothetical protein